MNFRKKPVVIEAFQMTRARRGALMNNNVVPNFKAFGKWGKV